MTRPSTKRYTQKGRPALATAMALIFGAVMGLQAATVNSFVLSPNSTLYGKTYSQWATAWNQWAFSIPAAINPINDSTGQYAGNGQSGPVWFLGGTFGGSAERTITVPAGKALFFPVVVSTWVNLPDLGDNPWSKDQESFARDNIGGQMDSATELSCEVDGVPVQKLANYRCKTPKGGAYLVNVPQGDIWCLTDCYGLTPGVYGPAVDDGIYLMLFPLTTGQHTLHFKGALTAIGFSLEVTYHITVQ